MFKGSVGQFFRVLVSQLSPRRRGYAAVLHDFGLTGFRTVRFWSFVRREWRHWLSERSQKGKVTWEAFLDIEEKHLLVAPKIRISYPQLASYVRL
jgi:hypothetical protein